jgi:hypothetical protein
VNIWLVAVINCQGPQELVTRTGSLETTGDQAVSATSITGLVWIIHPECSDPAFRVMPV